MSLGELESFPAEMRFRGSLRPYQHRVLDALEKSMGDDSLHVVAAPGSGKTVLGIEAVRRLNRPAVILAPTIAIRDQWIERLRCLFLPSEEATPDWISTNARDPRLFTALTYQALHCAYTGDMPDVESEDSEDGCTPEYRVMDATKVDVVGLLKRAGVGTIVVDEAHHLRASWWKTLSDIREKLGRPAVIALTATPPYDVSAFEWARYKDLCGPVDAEISVPELVIDGNLCPHQDYVYFNRPSEEESKAILHYRTQVDEICRALQSDSDFIAAVQSHPWISKSADHVEDILSNPGFFSAMLIYLKSVTGSIPPQLPETLGLSASDLPPLDDSWMETLLTGCLYGYVKDFAGYEDRFSLLRERLSSIEAVEHRQVRLKSTDKIDKALAASINKLDSVLQIVRLESSSLGEQLRMVILTDYIRQSMLPKSPSDLRTLSSIGVTTIFEKIRRNQPAGVKLGILSGSLVIIPSSARDALERFSSEDGGRGSGLTVTASPFDAGYCIVEPGTDSSRIVGLMTKLFSMGEISVMVGTKSLLGEGWDAPCINALILASFVGSYMLSNQMRGRAIRSMKDDPCKTANIWHLVCVENGGLNGAGADLEVLRRRFKAFVGPGLDEPIVQNGIDRLDIGRPPYWQSQIDAIDSRMCELATNRSGMRDLWKSALQVAESEGRLVESVAVRKEKLPKRFVLENTLRALLLTGLGAGYFVWSQMTTEAVNQYQGSADPRYLGWAAGVSSLVTLPWLVRAGWLFVRHGSIESSMKQVGRALLESLCASEAIKTPVADISVRASRRDDGSVACWIVGGTSQELNVFLDAVQELLDPVDNPRYLIVRPTAFLGTSRIDYHSVPAVLGTKKEYAEDFAGRWMRYVGKVELVYARTIEGRKTLLKARQGSLSAHFIPKSERTSKWM